MKTCTPFHILVIFGLIVTASLVSGPAAGSASLLPHAIYSSVLDLGEGQAFTLNGVIKSVDYASNIIVVRLPNADIETVRITPTTAVEKKGQIGSIADLRP